MKAAGKKLLEMGARAVIVTGGHLERPSDVLCEGTQVEVFGGDHVKSPNTHGSGCTFSAAIAAQLAGGQQLARSRDSRQGLCHQGHREVLSDRQRRRSAKSAFPLPPGDRLRAVSTKFPSTVCILPRNPPRINPTLELRRCRQCGPRRWSPSVRRGSVRPSKGVFLDLLGESRGAKGPGAIGGKNRQVRGCTSAQLPLDAQHSRRSGRE